MTKKTPSVEFIIRYICFIKKENVNKTFLVRLVSTAGVVPGPGPGESGDPKDQFVCNLNYRRPKYGNTRNPLSFIGYGN